MLKVEPLRFPARQIIILDEKYELGDALEQCDPPVARFLRSSSVVYSEMSGEENRGEDMRKGLRTLPAGDEREQKHSGLIKWELCGPYTLIPRTEAKKEEGVVDILVLGASLNSPQDARAAISLLKSMMSPVCYVQNVATSARLWKSTSLCMENRFLSQRIVYSPTIFTT